MDFSTVEAATWADLLKRTFAVETWHFQCWHRGALKRAGYVHDIPDTVGILLR